MFEKLVARRRQFLFLTLAVKIWNKVYRQAVNNSATAQSTTVYP